MFQFIKKTIVKPGLERLGTIAAVAILAGGDKLCASVSQTCGLVTPDGVDTAVQYGTVVALVLYDLGVIMWNRRGH